MELLARIRGILANPEQEWRIIERESGEPAYLFVRYVAILAVIPAVAGFIGMSLIGVTVTAGTFRVPPLPGLVYAFVSYCFTFVIVYLVALLIDLLAPLFRGQRYFPNAMKLAVYSFTPVWLAGIFLILPGLQLLTLLSLYGFYILWTGLHWLMRVERGKAALFALVIVICAFGITAALSVIQARILI